jgi:hypothetical protein
VAVQFHLPSLPAVNGERLLPVRLAGVDPGPLVANPHRPAVEGVVAFERAETIGEATYHRLVQLAAGVVGGPPDPPHLVLGVVEPQREAFEGSLRAAQYIEGGIAVEQ